LMNSFEELLPCRFPHLPCRTCRFFSFHLRYLIGNLSG
jgi:hypothetical protein